MSHAPLIVALREAGDPVRWKWAFVRHSKDPSARIDAVKIIHPPHHQEAPPCQLPADLCCSAK